MTAVGRVPNAVQADAWRGAEGRHWVRNADRYDALAGAANDIILHAAAPGPDERVLDVGCGTGQLSRAAARLAAEVVGVDISDTMIAEARRRARGLDTVRCTVADAQRHRFACGPFDAIISRAGTTMFDDPVAAHANLWRAVRPGGRFVALVPRPAGPGSPARQALAALNGLLVHDSPAQHNMVTKPAALLATLRASNWSHATATPCTVDSRLGDDPDDAAAFLLQTGPIRTNVQHLPPEQLARLHTELAAGLTPFAGPDGVHLPKSHILLSARRPESPAR